MINQRRSTYPRPRACADKPSHFSYSAPISTAVAASCNEERGVAVNNQESTVAHGPEHGLERLIFFSDAVFAIAITLLVIDLHVPHLVMGSPDRAYLIALINISPEFVGFFLSFFVIGTFWAGHHRTMLLASHYAASLTMPNLIFLSSIAAMPFFTAFASANPMMRVPAVCYCGWLLLTALLNRRLQAVVTRAPIVSETATPEQIKLVRVRGTSVVLGAAAATIVSIFIPVLGQVTLSTIPLWRRLLGGKMWIGVDAGPPSIQVDDFELATETGTMTGSPSAPIAPTPGPI